MLQGLPRSSFSAGGGEDGWPSSEGALGGNLDSWPRAGPRLARSKRMLGSGVTRPFPARLRRDRGSGIRRAVSVAWRWRWFGEASEPERLSCSQAFLPRVGERTSAEAEGKGPCASRVKTPIGYLKLSLFQGQPSGAYRYPCMACICGSVVRPEGDAHHVWAGVISSEPDVCQAQVQPAPLAGPEGQVQSNSAQANGNLHRNVCTVTWSKPAQEVQKAVQSAQI